MWGVARRPGNRLMSMALRFGAGLRVRGGSVCGNWAVCQRELVQAGSGISLSRRVSVWHQPFREFLEVAAWGRGLSADAVDALGSHTLSLVLGCAHSFSRPPPFPRLPCPFCPCAKRPPRPCAWQVVQEPLASWADPERRPQSTLGSTALQSAAVRAAGGTPRLAQVQGLAVGRTGPDMGVPCALWVRYGGM